MKKETKKRLRLLLALVLIFSLAMLVRQMTDNATGSDSYAQALALAKNGGGADISSGTPEAAREPDERVLDWVPASVEGDPHIEELSQISLKALQEVNPHVIGWIRIPDSNVDYPIMQGEDNEYYLKNTWDNRKSSVGSIFMECRNTPDFMDYNTILYGHNMNDGSMFAAIKRYSTQWYQQRHPYVYILTEQGVFRYEVFAAYETDTGSKTYGLSFRQQETKDAFMDHIFEKSAKFYETVPGYMDRILTLSTCSGMGQDSRYVIHASLKMVLTEVEQ